MTKALFHISAVVASLLLPLTLGAQVNGRTFQRLDPLGAIVDDRALEYSAGAALSHPSASFSEAGLAYDGRREDEAYLPQAGDGLNQGEFFAKSLYRLDSLSVVTGKVSYQRGVKNNVIWNETSDFGMLYPYVAADSVGGNLQKEQYSFAGSYSRMLGRWHVGASLDYRALHEWRSSDPRPRNITSDFKATLSGGYSFGKYLASASATYHKYHQSQNIEFLASRGASSTIFHMTGLGSHYERFAGTKTYSTTSYIGHGFTASTLLQPIGGKGVRAGLKYDLLKTKAHLTNQNDTPITELLDQELGGFASYGFTAGKYVVGLDLHADYELRQGTENVIDNVSTGNYLDLLDLTMYRRKVLSAGLDGVIERGKFYLMPSVYGYFSKAKYLYPERVMDFSYAGAEAYAGYRSSFSGGWLADVRLGGGFCAGLSSEFDLPGDHTDSVIYAAYAHMFYKFTDNYAIAGMKARVQKEIGRIGAVFAGLSVRDHMFVESGNSIMIRFEAGLAF